MSRRFLLGSGLGMVGAVAKPGVDLLLTMISTANAGLFWWLASHGERSIRVSRWLDAGGLLFNSSAAPSWDATCSPALPPTRRWRAPRRSTSPTAT